MSNEEVYHQSPKIVESSNPAAVEKGWFDFMKKKEEPDQKCEETAISTEFEEKVNVSEPEPVLEEKNETLLEKFHQSHDGSSGSSSSDEEEEGEDGEKKKKKKQKPLKQVIEEKFEDYKENKEEEKIEKQEEDTYVPVEKCEEVAVPPPHSEVVYPTPTPEPEGKKGFMEKIKHKLPGGHKKAEEEHVAPPPPAPVTAPCEPMPAAPSYDGLPMPAAPSYDGLEEPKEKKGILEKIKEKIPGYHSKSEEEKEKEKVKE